LIDTHKGSPRWKINKGSRIYSRRVITYGKRDQSGAKLKKKTGSE